MHLDPSIEKIQIERLRVFKEKRNLKLVNESLDKIRNAAMNPNINLMPYFIEAVENNATLGEISDALRQVYGVYKEES